LNDYYVECTVVQLWEGRELTKEFEIAVAAAEAAGEVLWSGFGQRLDVRYKGEVDLVTEADEKAEQKIMEVLREAFPDYGMLTEESGESEGEGGSRWIVDPLDGTTNYAHGVPIFATSIALEREGEVVLGVVHDPMSEETYAAERGGGATLNGQTIQVSDADELIRALLATGFPYDRDEVSAALDLFGRFAVLTQSIRRLGSAALDLCYVAAGRFDGYYERGINAWDIAAGVLILEEAGGKATNYSGRELGLAGREVVASNGLLHSELVGVTGEHAR
jgi:myo-inositol-1(or 4)-monophosphatase